MPTWPKDHDAEIPPQIEALIFDCDGTLVDTMPLHFVAWTKTLEKHGMKLSEQRFYEFAGMPTAKIVEILAAEEGLRVSPDEIANEKEQMYLKSLPAVQKIHRVVDIAVREFGKRKLAVASGGHQKLVRQVLRTMELEQYFPVIIGADDVPHGKPAPDMFLKAAHDLGVKPENCVVYEDGELGFRAARAAGMQVIDVRPWYLPRSE